MAKSFSAEQMIALEYLATPNKGGLTYEQIAEKCGVTVQTLWRWRNDAAFDAERVRRSNRIVGDVIADIHEWAINAFKEDPHNAALYRELKKAAGETDKIEIDTNQTVSVDTESLKRRLDELRKGNGDGAA